MGKNKGHIIVGPVLGLKLYIYLYNLCKLIKLRYLIKGDNYFVIVRLNLLSRACRPHTDGYAKFIFMQNSLPYLTIDLLIESPQLTIFCILYMYAQLTFSSL